MWAIVNHTPYRVKKTWGRDQDGAHQWIVAVKATFDVKPDGKVVLAEEQVDPLLVPEYNGEDGTSSLRYDADLVGPKPTTDVVLNGTAYSPKGRPSNDFLVSMRVAGMEKTIRVVGSRKWERSAFGLTPSAAEPITALPIVYERAYGGYDHTDPDPKNQRMDSRNPVGCGVVAKSTNPVGQPLPNFQYPTGSLEESGPAGFGAIDSYWSPRRELQGTYDAAWQQNRLPLLPEDWDPHSMLCSPADQRPTNRLFGGELVELINLTPKGMLRFVLPKVHLTFRTNLDGRLEEHRSRLSTVVIEPDYPRVMMVWLTALICRTNVDYLENTVVGEKPYV